MGRDDLLRELSALDFVAVDLQLFLDTHPDDREALMKYNQIVTKANQVRCEYETKYGPLTSFRTTNNNGWNWYCDPWPWNYCANFKLPGEVCR